MASLNVKTEYSEYKDCKLRVGKYVEDNTGKRRPALRRWKKNFAVG